MTKQIQETASFELPGNVESSFSALLFITSDTSWQSFRKNQTNRLKVSSEYQKNIEQKKKLL